METITQTATTAQTGAVITETIASLTKLEIKFLQVAISKDKTRESLQFGTVRYADKLNGFIVATTDTHRLHVVCAGNNGNLHQCKTDINHMLDIDLIGRQMTALKLDTVEITARISYTGEFIGVSVESTAGVEIHGAIVAKGNYPNVDKVIPDSFGIEHRGLKGAFNPRYMVDAMAHITPKKETEKVHFWQEKSLHPAVVFDHTMRENELTLEPGRKFALIMPMHNW